MLDVAVIIDGGSWFQSSTAAGLFVGRGGNVSETVLSTAVMVKRIELRLSYSALHMRLQSTRWDHCLFGPKRDSLALWIIFASL